MTGLAGVVGLILLVAGGVAVVVAGALAERTPDRGRRRLELVLRWGVGAPLLLLGAVAVGIRLFG